MNGIPEFQALRQMSARVGSDPLLVQAAGGNTSIKQDGIMHIKASGTWLMNALRDEIFVPVRLDALREALGRGDPAAESCRDFVDAEANPLGLRPSIETSVHAVFPQRVVVHVHCVATIAAALRTDAEAVCADRLQGMNWALVPYVKPGMTLANRMATVMQPETDVVVLGNHGLVVAAETVAAAEGLLHDVSRRMESGPRPAPAHEPALLAAASQGTRYLPAPDPAAHGVATDPVSLGHAACGSLYPDHVIFLGPGVVISEPGETAAMAAARAMATGLPEPVMIVVPGAGVLMREDATPGAQALARCLADVTARIPSGAPVNVLTDAENAELLDWDAEKYRQALNAGTSG